MTILFLVRHGRSTANTAGVLAGRAEGVELDEQGRTDARAVGERLAGVAVTTVVTSPVLRCRQTTDLLLEGAGLDLAPEVDERLTECDYGSWTNRPLTELAKEPAWAQIQATPTSVTFPDGESMSAMFDRVEAALADWRVRVAAADPHAVWLMVSHGDPIKALLAHCLGMERDAFQRLVVDPGSVSAVQLGSAPDARPLVLATNSVRRSLSTLVPKVETEAAVGGGLGVDPSTPPD